MGERDDAKRSVESTRARIGVLAHEVSRRMTPDYAKERAKEMARDKAYVMRDRAADNPWMLPLLGAGIGAFLGKAITGRVQGRRERYWDERSAYRGDYGRGDRYGLREDERYEVWAGEDVGVAPIDETDETGLEPGGPSIRDRAADAKERAAEMKDRASEKLGEVKERFTDRASGMKESMRSRAYDLRDRIPAGDELRANARENPALWAFGAMAVGALFALALPVTESERRALAPAKGKLREAGQQAAQKVSEKVSEKVGTTGARQQAEEPGSDLGIGSPSPMPPTSGPEPLH